MGRDLCRDNCHDTTGGQTALSGNKHHEMEPWGSISMSQSACILFEPSLACFQAKLISKGVEVVEFDFLTPDVVADYCYDRGFLQCFWECGGMLAAPCISGNVIHKVCAYIEDMGGMFGSRENGMMMGLMGHAQGLCLRGDVWGSTGKTSVGGLNPEQHIAA